MNGAFSTRIMQAKLGQENLLIWRDESDDNPLDTGFEIRALVVWGRVRYLSATQLTTLLVSFPVGIDL